MPQSLLAGRSVPGAVYLVRVTPTTAIDPSQAATISNSLRTSLPAMVPGCAVQQVTVTANQIDVQLIGGFTWSAISAALPSILAVVGVVIAFIAMYFVVASVPSWAYALGGMAILALIILPRVMR